MSTNQKAIEEAIRDFDFKRLFIEELGWDRHQQELRVELPEGNFVLRAAAEKRGLIAFICSAAGASPPGVPSHAIRVAVERHVRKMAHEHLIVFVDQSKKSQVWQWVKREPGRPLATREHTFSVGQRGTALAQKLERLAVALAEEQDLTLVDVTSRARAAFDVERITKRFYERFKKEHTAFLKFIVGIQEASQKEWYASVMLNRLMFVYFIQKKGFLDGDTNYLRNRLQQIRERRGRDKFYSFYRTFLLRLFHDGLGTPVRSQELIALIGRVPYLNGGLFDLHELERSNPEIEIADEAFSKLFDFFDAYQWHLDERPVRGDSEINPDVIGYIFEKYINQKELGAYYTKEDITGYITRSTVLPRVLELTKEDCDIAFRGDGAAWSLLRDNPDRYLYPLLIHGIDIELPPAITVGIANPSKRKAWSARVDDPQRAHETETWREFMARRSHANAVRTALASGNVHDIADLVRLNVNIEQFVLDVIQTCEGPELLRAIYRALIRLSVLDPTCGSGAFLFAALEILEPLYEACLDRMQVFVADSMREGAVVAQSSYEDFKTTLESVAKHPSRRYFILKNIMVNNLFGVDIMPEAVEICKLRLFLKLMAQADDLSQVEPLPDIDFNVRAGNSLVGFASMPHLERTYANRLGLDSGWETFRELAGEVAKAYAQYQSMQTQDGATKELLGSAKRDLLAGFAKLRQQLDVLLAKDYGVNTSKQRALDEWKASHTPFHWVAEFFGIIGAGGFDVIVGNPPYVEYGEVKDYRVLGYRTEDCGNLYAFSTERAIDLLNTSGALGFIIPVASVCTEGYRTLQDVLRSQADLVVSTFNDRPGKLFDGLEHIRLAIILAYRRRGGERTVATTRYQRWLTSERERLFQCLEFGGFASQASAGTLVKIGSEVEASILRKLRSQGRPLQMFQTKLGRHSLYYTRKLSGFVQVLDFVPKFYANGKKQQPSELKEIRYATAEERDASLAILNSNLFFWYISVMSDVRNLNKREVESIPFDIGKLDQRARSRISALSRKLMADMDANSEMREMQYKSFGKRKIQCIFPKRSKAIIDEIDQELAAHFGFTAEEVEFLINYDLKYRVGVDLDDENAA